MIKNALFDSGTFCLNTDSDSKNTFIDYWYLAPWYVLLPFFNGVRKRGNVFSSTGFFLMVKVADQREKIIIIVMGFAHTVGLGPNVSTTPLRQWGFWQCLSSAGHTKR